MLNFFFPKLRLEWCLAGARLDLTVYCPKFTVTRFGQFMSPTNQIIPKHDQDDDYFDCDLELTDLNLLQSLISRKIEK